MRCTYILSGTLGFVLLAMGCQRPAGPSFKLNLNESLTAAASEEYLLQAADFETWKNNAGKDLLLVDLRPVAEFEKGHLDGARNIPLPQLLEAENLDLLHNNQPVVLLAESVSLASGPRLLLTQLGFKNIKILAVPAYPAPNTTADEIAPETARYDFASIFKQATERHAKELEAGKPKPALPNAGKKAVIPEKKPAPKAGGAEEEGC